MTTQLVTEQTKYISFKDIKKYGSHSVIINEGGHVAVYNALVSLNRVIFIDNALWGIGKNYKWRILPNNTNIMVKVES